MNGQKRRRVLAVTALIKLGYGKLPQKRGRTLTPESAGRYPVGTALINPGARAARPAGPGLPAGGDAADYETVGGESVSTIYRDSPCPATCPDGYRCGPGTRGTCLPPKDTGIDVDDLRSKVQLALYHGGLVGCPQHGYDASGPNPKCYIAYLKEVVRFVEEKSIDIVYVVLSMPIFNIEQGKYQFPFYLDPTFLAEHFLKPLGKVVLSKGPNKGSAPRAGVVAYIRAKDSNWNFQQSPAEAAAGPFKDAECVQSDGSVAPCTFANPYHAQLRGGYEIPSVPDPKNATWDTKCGVYADVLGASNACPALYKFGKEGCGSRCDASACPNIAAQVVSYIKSVNAAVGSGKTKIEFMSYDGEDAGSMADAWSLCQFRMADEGLPDVPPPATNLITVDGVRVLKENVPRRTNLVHFGYAKAAQAGPAPPGGDYTMPETYWYMGELWPCTGDGYQIGTKTASGWKGAWPAVCTELTSYRAFKNDPSGWLGYVERSDKCMNGDKAVLGVNPPGSIYTNVHNWAETAVKQKREITSPVWPMFSLENLSATSGDPGARTCIAYEAGYGPDALKNKNPPEKLDVCGTFDGFAYWSWDKFLETMMLFAHRYMRADDGNVLEGATVGVYESQFIPPEWFEDGKFRYIREACDCSVGGGGGGSSVCGSRDKGADADAACDTSEWFSRYNVYKGTPIPGAQVCSGSRSERCECQWADKMVGQVYDSPGKSQKPVGDAPCCYSCKPKPPAGPCDGRTEADAKCAGVVTESAKYGKTYFCQSSKDDATSCPGGYCKSPGQIQPVTVQDGSTLCCHSCHM